MLSARWLLRGLHIAWEVGSILLQLRQHSPGRPVVQAECTIQLRRPAAQTAEFHWHGKCALPDWRARQHSAATQPHPNRPCQCDLFHAHNQARTHCGTLAKLVRTPSWVRVAAMLRWRLVGSRDCRRKKQKKLWMWGLLMQALCSACQGGHCYKAVLTGCCCRQRCLPRHPQQRREPD